MSYFVFFIATAAMARLLMWAMDRGGTRGFWYGVAVWGGFLMSHILRDLGL